MSPTATPTSPSISEKMGHMEWPGGIRLFQLWYRRGNRKPDFLIFQHKGDLPDAIKRSQLHCTKMDLRFCGCYPFVVDLDMREKYREENMEAMGIEGF